MRDALLGKDVRSHGEWDLSPVIIKFEHRSEWMRCRSFRYKEIFGCPFLNVFQPEVRREACSLLPV